MSDSKNSLQTQQLKRLSKRSFYIINKNETTSFIVREIISVLYRI